MEITIQKGNPHDKTIKVTSKSTGAAYDLTGKTVFFTMKLLSDDTANDDAAFIKKTITSHTNPTGGITTLALTTTDTNQTVGRYKCDIRIYSAGGVQLNSTKFFAAVEDIVTKRTS
jgi:hypothetical protein